MSDGKDYERFVQSLQQALLDSEYLTNKKNINVQINKKIEDNCGIVREFDLYWEYELAGVTYKTVIECKDYKSRVTVEKIDALIGKIKDIPDLKPVFATKTGYQSGAITKAEKNKIELLIVREQNDSDWVDDDGNPLVREVNITIQIGSPVRITGFNPLIDGDWLKENTDIDTSKPISFGDLSDNIFIQDVEKDEKYSIHELENKMVKYFSDNYGELTHTDTFNDAYLISGDIKLKIKSYVISYVLSPPTIIPIKIDFSRELKGVIEYLSKNTKTVIFKDRIIKDW